MLLMNMKIISCFDIDVFELKQQCYREAVVRRWCSRCSCNLLCYQNHVNSWIGFKWKCNKIWLDYVYIFADGFWIQWLESINERFHVITISKQRILKLTSSIFCTVQTTHKTHVIWMLYVAKALHWLPKWNCIMQNAELLERMYTSTTIVTSSTLYFIKNR